MSKNELFEKFDELKMKVEHCVYIMSRIQSGEERNYTWQKVFNTLNEWVEKENIK